MIDNNNFIELRPVGLTKGTSMTGVYILLLRESNDNRCLPLLISEDGFKKVHHAMVDDIPEEEVLTEVITTFNIAIEGIYIISISHGEMRSMIVLNQLGDYRTVETSLGNGINTAIRNKVPIRMNKELYNSIIKHQPSDGLVSFPITTLTGELLEEALKTAVDEDKFELASLLRDEINKREHNQ